MAAFGKAIKSMTAALRPKPAPADSTAMAGAKGAPIKGPTPKSQVTIGNRMKMDALLREADGAIEQQSHGRCSEEAEAGAMIRKVKKGYRLVSHSGKSLGTYKTKKEAQARERQVRFFKHKKS